MATSALSRFFAGTVASLRGYPGGQPLLFGGSAERPIRDWYAELWDYYVSNGKYDDVAQALAIQAIAAPAIKPLRNPANRVVELHVAKVWPGALPDALPIVTDNERLLPAIEQVWEWSNWATQKQVFIRKLACLGDIFMRVATTAAPDGTPLPPEQTRVYFQLISPEYVPDFDANERGDLTYIRVDIPQTERIGDRVEPVTHTEVWEKGVAADGSLGRVRKWRHTKGDEQDLEKLGPPQVDVPLLSYGIDFLPFRHAKFRDTGSERGVGAFAHALDKIDAANLAATRLAQNLHRSNEEAWVLEGEGRVDDTGREIPPPQIVGLSSTTTENDGTVQVGDARLFRIPGGWTLRSMIPELNYEAEIAALRAQMEELEDDLPEMAYYRLREGGDAISGRALQKKLSALIDRVLEARGNAESCLIRLDQMALSIGQAAGLPLFAANRIGTYDAGDFAHTFAERPVLPTDTLEDAQAALARAQSVTEQMKWWQTAPPALLEQAGFSTDEIQALLDERGALAAETAAPALPAPSTASANGQTLPDTATMLAVMQRAGVGAPQA